MFVTAETPFVTVKKGDPSFTLQGPISVAQRASMLISDTCPNEYKWIIQQCLENNWIECVAIVPKTDPTLMWDTLKK